MRSWEEWTSDNPLSVNKAKYPCLGGMGSLSSLLPARIDTIEMALGGACRSGIFSIILINENSASQRASGLMCYVEKGNKTLEKLL